MTQLARKQVYLIAFQKYGMNAQMDIAVEEMSELTKELCKKKRGFDNRQNIVEEIADVMICLEQMRLLFNIKDDEIDDCMAYKVSRLEQRLKKTYAIAE